jgi:hypothetical protein
MRNSGSYAPTPVTNRPPTERASPFDISLFLIDYVVEDEAAKIILTARQIYRFPKTGSAYYPEARVAALP